MISIDPIQALKILKQAWNNSTASFSSYIKSIAEEADNLAAIWEEIARAVISNSKLNTELLEELMIHQYVPCNAKPHSRLQSYYLDLSSALGENKTSRKWVETMTQHVGSILYNRDKANIELDNILNSLSTTLAFDMAFNYESQEKSDLFDTLPKLVSQLRKDASVLHTLASKAAIGK